VEAEDNVTRPRPVFEPKAEAKAKILLYDYS